MYHVGAPKDWIDELDWPHCSPEVVESVLSSIKSLPVLTSLDLDVIANDLDGSSSDGFPSPSTESPVTTPSTDYLPAFPTQFASPVMTPGSDGLSVIPSIFNQVGQSDSQVGASVCSRDTQYFETSQTESQYPAPHLQRAFSDLEQFPDVLVDVQQVPEFNSFPPNNLYSSLVNSKISADSHYFDYSFDPTQLSGYLSPSSDLTPTTNFFPVFDHSDTFTLTQ